MNYKPREIRNVIKCQQIGYPEWIYTIDEKGGKTFLSISDDSVIRYRVQDEDYDRLLFFSKSCAVYYRTDQTLFFDENEIVRESIDKNF